MTSETRPSAPAGPGHVTAAQPHPVTVAGRRAGLLTRASPRRSSCTSAPTVAGRGKKVRITPWANHTYFRVVVNQQREHSLWPLLGPAVPAGWLAVGFTGDWATCLQYLNEVEHSDGPGAGAPKSRPTVLLDAFTRACTGQPEPCDTTLAALGKKLSRTPSLSDQPRRLQRRFRQLGDLRGRWLDDIVQATGRPSSLSSTPTGRLVQWQAAAATGSYRITLEFDGADRCVRVIDDTAV